MPASTDPALQVVRAGPALAAELRGRFEKQPAEIIAARVPGLSKRAGRDKPACLLDRPLEAASGYEDSSNLVAWIPDERCPAPASSPATRVHPCTRVRAVCDAEAVTRTLMWSVHTRSPVLTTELLDPCQHG